MLHPLWPCLAHSFPAYDWVWDPLGEGSGSVGHSAEGCLATKEGHFVTPFLGCGFGADRLDVWEGWGSERVEPGKSSSSDFVGYCGHYT